MYWRTLLAQMGTKWRHDDSPLASFSDGVKFLRRDSRVYSIGSCFALNINRWLKFQGFDVPDVTWGIHYNSRTILYELRRAAGYSVPDVEWRIPRPDGSEVYADALRHCIDAPDADRLASIKAQIAAESRQEFMRSDAFIVTLGLSDIWEAEINGQLITLNRSPYVGVTPLNGERHGPAVNRFLSVAECVEDLRQIVQIVRATRPSGTPVIFTISPVPLKHTGGKAHPHIANGRSKATLLAAIHTFLDECHQDPDVHYFPAYDFFQMHGLGLPLWQGDGRHPTTEAVAHVAESFVRCYSADPISVKPGFSVAQFT